MNNSDTFHILALDGGGTRGIYTAQLLAKLEHNLGVPIKDCFHLIAGTSTGSIIAGAAASNISMDEIVELFETEAPEIFRKKWYRNPLFFSKYSNEKLTQIIAKHIPARPLSEISTPLFITSSEITKSEFHVFRSKYANALKEYEHSDGNVCVRDAIVASCAAPTFFAPQNVNDQLLADGGLWANNPSIAAYVEALTTFGKKVSQIRLLSIGTGHSTAMYKDKRGWGFLSGWGGVKLVSYVMTLQSHTSAEMLKRILKTNYLRIDPVIDFWDLDTVVQLDKLKSYAERDFGSYQAEIKSIIRPLF